MTLILASDNEESPLRMMKRMKKPEARKGELEGFLSDGEEPPPYRTQVAALYDALQ